MLDMLSVPGISHDSSYGVMSNNRLFLFLANMSIFSKTHQPMEWSTVVYRDVYIDVSRQFKGNRTEEKIDRTRGD